jgi:hypothetical protein
MGSREEPPMKRYLKIIRRLPRLARAGLLATAAGGGASGRTGWALWAIVGLIVVGFAVDVGFDLMGGKEAT